MLNFVSTLSWQFYLTEATYEKLLFFALSQNQEELS
ncbi:MAG: hypothetical protein BWX62_00562 [Bacteroidetes bacterium ADurb.Bin037]|nr:MAG: hypothetical protein BWX62_00562 [Bacteroidetes bacterium ADurb.Bin037]